VNFFNFWIRERVGDPGISNNRVSRAGKEYAREYAMDRQLQTWRSGDGQKLWLSMLVDAMEEAARPEFRSIPCDRLTLAAVRAQLARPASPYAYRVSHYSLRN
jgi:hypothetical protein